MAWQEGVSYCDANAPRRIGKIGANFPVDNSPQRVRHSIETIGGVL
jgi:hypothetical protein